MEARWSCLWKSDVAQVDMDRTVWTESECENEKQVLPIMYCKQQQRHIEQLIYFLQCIVKSIFIIFYQLHAKIWRTQNKMRCLHLIIS